MELFGGRGRHSFPAKVSKALLACVASVSVLASAALVGIPSQAFAYTSAPGFSVTTWASGFAAPGHNVGPVGIAFDSPSPTTSNGYVLDYPTGLLYRFPHSGGVASPATLVNPTPIGPVGTDGTVRAGGLAFSLDYVHLYATLQRDGKVEELNPSDGTVVRIVATGMKCPSALVTDPLSGDLFVSNACSNGVINRINPSTGVVTIFANLPCDGLAFDPRDGTLYAATLTGIVKVDRSGGMTVMNLAGGPTDGDGIGLITDKPAGTPPSAFINSHHGTITLYDLSTSPAVPTRVATGGTRGDLAILGPDGCLYADQTTQVLKATKANGDCWQEFMTGEAFGLSANGTALGILPLTIPPTPRAGPVATSMASTTTPDCVVSLPLGVVSALSLCAGVTTTVAPDSSTARATVAQAAIGVPGLPAIGLTTVQATSHSVCGSSTGSSTIVSLTIAGFPAITLPSPLPPNYDVIKALGLPPLPLGAKLILNEQITTLGPGAGDSKLTVNAVHLTLPPILGTSADVIVASATSDVHNCP